MKTSTEKTNSKTKTLIISIVAIILYIGIVIATIAIMMGVSKKTYEEYVSDGINFMNTYKYEQAETEFLLAIDLEPRKADAYKHLTNVYIVTDRPKVAKAVLNKASKNVPTFSEDKEFVDLEAQVNALIDGEGNQSEASKKENEEKIGGDLDVKKLYYAYINENLVPEKGFASTDAAIQMVSMDNMGWDQRNGLISAYFVDLDQNNIDECVLIHCATREENAQYWDLIMDVYTMREDGKIVQVGSEVIECFNSIHHEIAKIGIVYIDERPYIFDQSSFEGYFVTGISYGIIFYTINDHGLVPKWYVGKTDGGSDQLVYSLRTYEADGENYHDDEIGYIAHSEHPGSTITEPESIAEGLRRMGIDWELPYFYPYVYDEEFPTLWDAKNTEKICSYQCATTSDVPSYDNYMELKTDLIDETKLKENIEILTK